MWLFFDLGCTLLDERRAEARFDRLVYRLLRNFGSVLRFTEYLNFRREIVENRVARGHRELAIELFRRYGKRGGVNEFLLRFDSLHTFELYSALWTIYGDVRPALRLLSSEHPLGLIANQDRKVRLVLEGKGLTPYFNVLGISGEVGYAKPDRRLFTQALQIAGAEASKSVMIGDRVDTDIAPANSLGMTTIRVKRESVFSVLEPRNELERPSFEVDDLREIAELPL